MFSMVKLVTDRESMSFHSYFAGPLLDDCAPYSGVGFVELSIIKQLIFPNWNGSLDKISESIADRPYWQYGIGEHSNSARKIMASLFIDVRTDGGNVINIRHLVIEGSSRWVIGRNVTKHCNTYILVEMHYSYPVMTVFVIR